MEYQCKAVIFDMDGLILDTETLAKKAFKEVAKKLNIHVSESVYDQLIGRNEKSSTEFLIEKYGADFPIQKIFTEVRTYMDLHMEKHGIPVKKGLKELLDMLDNYSIPRGVGTSSKTERAIKKLDIAGLTHRFPIIIGGDQIENGKPAPDLFLKVAKYLKIEPQYCVVLEDSEPGIRAASAGGMIPLLIPDLIPPSDESRKRAYQIFPSLLEAKELIVDFITES